MAWYLVKPRDKFTIISTQQKLFQYGVLKFDFRPGEPP